MKFSSIIACLFTVLTPSVFAGWPASPENGQERPAWFIQYQFEPGELDRLCKEALDRAETKTRSIAELAPEERTTDNTLLAFEQTTADLGEKTTPLAFMAYVSTDAGLREEASDCETEVAQFSISIFTQKPLYEAIRDASPRTPEEARLLSETVEAFEKNGLALPEARLAKVRELKAQLAALETEFAANLNNDTSTVEFTREELDGVPTSFLDRLEQTPEGNYIVTTKSTDYVQVMENAVQGETRRRMLFAYANRAAEENTRLLDDAILLRQQIASELGYPTWADYRIEGRMADSAEQVREFLTGLKARLAQRNREDLAALLAIKRELEPGATELYSWDIAYTANQLKKRDYQLDDELIREFFPAEGVMQGMFQIYSQLLGVDFREHDDASVWAPNVKLYEVIDRASDETTAWFYTDFFPRAGKYGHAAAFTLIAGRETAKGYNQPVAAIVANFTPPSAGKPSLLDHDEVETVFHEFGHIMHQVLTRAPYASLSGTATSQDFVEAPSQMLENWVWDPEMLNLISGHYEDLDRELPPELLTQMIRARDFNQGHFYTRQLLLGLTDLAFHTSQGPVDVTAVYDQLYREIIGIDPIAGGHSMASFGHLMGGYDAGYYGYIWSEVYAADMFTEFERTGLLNEETGQRYRNTILERGNMQEPITLVRDFLGRKPNSEAFYRKLGIE
jgi:thimet oligopeptidase